jgi:hypothetical protein
MSDPTSTSIEKLGSNFGELLGALTVFMLADRVATPMPWLRLDALALNVSFPSPCSANHKPQADTPLLKIVWIMPTFSRIARKNVTWVR